MGAIVVLLLILLGTGFVAAGVYLTIGLGGSLIILGLACFVLAVLGSRAV